MRGKFLANGKCGYVLKPAAMREQYSCFSLKDGLPTQAPHVLHMKVKFAKSIKIINFSSGPQVLWELG